jgi:hypothetical protein
MALRYHPDRVPAAEPASVRERAAWRMREVNEAWQVLRSPGRRAAYDQALVDERAQLAERLGTTLSHLPSADPSFEGVPGLAEDPAAGAAVASAHAAARGRAPQRSPVRRARGGIGPLGPLVVLGLLLLGTVVAATLAKPNLDEDLDVATTDRFPPGSCVRVYTDRTAQIVSCDLPNSGRVARVVQYPLPCPPATETVVLPGGATLCLVDPALPVPDLAP